MSAIVDPPGGPSDATPPSPATPEPSEVDAGSRADGAAAPAAAPPASAADAGHRAHAARAGDAVGAGRSAAAAGSAAEIQLRAIAADLDAGRIDGPAAVERILDQAGLDVAAHTSPALRDRLVEAVRAVAGDDPLLVALATQLGRAGRRGEQR